MGQGAESHAQHLRGPEAEKIHQTHQIPAIDTIQVERGAAEIAATPQLRLPWS